MALKMIGSQLVEQFTTGKEEELPQLDLNLSSDALQRQVDRINAGEGFTGVFGKEIIAFAPKIIIPVIEPTIRNLSDGTIIPRMDTAFPVETISELMREYMPDSEFSPGPASILGLGANVGTILIMLGKAVVAEIAADVSMDTMKRIGQRVSPGYRIRGRTVNSVEGREVPRTGVKDESGRSGFLPNRKHYDGPCEWWEFWCWVV